jgi:hypothetical protein
VSPAAYRHVTGDARFRLFIERKLDSGRRGQSKVG